VRILIAEDHGPSLRMLEAGLRAAGHQVDACADWNEASWRSRWTATSSRRGSRWPSASLGLRERVSGFESLLPVFAWCKKIRDGESWLSLEGYVESRLGARASHALCPTCEASFPGLDEAEEPA